jgi:hypothetical protein
MRKKGTGQGYFRPVVPEGESKMVAVTYGSARVAPALAETKADTKSQGFFARILTAIAQAQMSRAERDLARYRHLLPLDHELRGGKLVLRGQQELPFGGY